MKRVSNIWRKLKEFPHKLARWIEHKFQLDYYIDNLHDNKKVYFQDYNPFNWEQSQDFINGKLGIMGLVMSMICMVIGASLIETVDGVVDDILSDEFEESEEYENEKTQTS